MPGACTLPTAERPLRVAEFEELFATALRGQQRLSPTRRPWRLDPAAEQAARDLTVRRANAARSFPLRLPGQTAGCTSRGRARSVADVLDALADQAAAARSGRDRLRSGQVAAAARVDPGDAGYYRRRVCSPSRTAAWATTGSTQPDRDGDCGHQGVRNGRLHPSTKWLTSSTRPGGAGRPRPGLHARARRKLAKVEAKFADLQVIAETLRRSG